MEVSDATANARYLYAKQIVAASVPFSDGSYAKNNLLKASEIVLKFLYEQQ